MFSRVNCVVLQLDGKWSNTGKVIERERAEDDIGEVGKEVKKN